MLRGLYTATNAMLTNERKVDVVTNNIANINTTGYKKDLVLTESFPEVLISKINSPLDWANREVFKGVEVTQEGRLYSVTTTGGFFRTKTPNGISHDRSLNFTVNGEGYLSTYTRDNNGNINTDGEYLVLGNRGPVQVGNGALEINERGQILVDGNMVDNLVLLMPPGVIGTLNGGARLDRIETNFEQGNLIETGNTLDLALKGKGFFQIETPEGIRYTRDGSFKLNTLGELVTSEGYRVMGVNGPIQIQGGEVSISSNGQVLQENQLDQQLIVIDIENIMDLRKTGNNLYRMEENVEAQPRPFTGEIVQGFLENANVDSIKEMVEMITLFRNYESNQRVIKAYDETLQRAANDIGKV